MGSLLLPLVAAAAAGGGAGAADCGACGAATHRVTKTGSATYKKDNNKNIV